MRAGPKARVARELVSTAEKLEKQRGSVDAAIDADGIDEDYDEGGKGAVEVGTVWNVGIADKIMNVDVGGVEDKKAIDVDVP